MIHFENVTPDNFEGVINLKLRDDQTGFLENNLYSLAESKVFDYLEPRAIYDDDRLIGFMLYYFQPYGVERQMGPGEGKHEIHSGGQDYIYFKRLMLDESEQGKGLGRASMAASIDYFKEEYPTAAFVELMHYLDNDTGASLYESLGFKSTGEVRRTLRPGTEDEYDEELVRRRYYMKHTEIYAADGDFRPEKYAEAEYADGRKVCLTEKDYTPEELDKFHAEESKWIVRCMGSHCFLADSDSGEDATGYYCGYFDLDPEKAIFKDGEFVGFYLYTDGFMYSGRGRASFEIDRWGYPGNDIFNRTTYGRDPHVFLFSEPESHEWKDWSLLERDPEKEYKSYLDF